MAKIGSDVMDLIHVFLLVPGQVGGSLQVLTREGHLQFDRTCSHSTSIQYNQEHVLKVGSTDSS